MLVIRNGLPLRPKHCHFYSTINIALPKDFEVTDYILIGTVTNTTITWRNNDTEASRDVQIHTDEVFKQPSISNNQLITIYTPKDRSGCGLKMKVNERWQVWATYTSMFSDDNTRRWLTVDSCGRTTKIYNRYSSHLRRLSNMTTIEQKRKY
ncbi:unnamed protein product [Rotaria sordida]|uniref:Uncharacterized protein n=1 Tax=Rotaria sordida TaxID=392033 RepID=A0A814L1U4_9BILA|nr:unnamed protein product [Rotaria sordida]CAF0930225.1 unnamed protein product [Rotaria sordida]CAF1054775.1 unnamed protein product [Rotaria sordida]CAF1057444.1 unnamed protein product [Rotaria sordida]CAF1220859.1 unnamed protein product [Rotaria sordida]